MKKAMLLMALALSLPCFVLAENRVGGRVQGGQSTNGLAGTAEMLASNAVLNVSITNNTAEIIRATNGVVGISVTNNLAGYDEMIASNLVLSTATDANTVLITNNTAEIIRATNDLLSITNGFVLETITNGVAGSSPGLWVPLFSADLGVSNMPITAGVTVLLDLSNTTFNADTGYNADSNGYITVVNGTYYFEFFSDLQAAMNEDVTQAIIRTNGINALFTRTAALAGSAQLGGRCSGYITLQTGVLVRCAFFYGAAGANQLQRDRKSTQFNGWRFDP